MDRLNLLQLAPGGSFGRFTIYTEGAAKRLGELFGTYKGGSSLKKGYTLPRAKMTNADIARIINSNEIQSVLETRKEAPKAQRVRKNPLTNNSVLGRLCPWAVTQKKISALAHKKGSVVQKAVEKKKAVRKAASKKQKKVSKAYFKSLEKAYEPTVEAADAEE